MIQGRPVWGDDYEPPPLPPLIGRDEGRPFPDHNEPFEFPPAPRDAEGWPLIDEDAEDEDMGDAPLNTLIMNIVEQGLAAHFAARPEYMVFPDLTVRYRRRADTWNVSPDVAVFRPAVPDHNAIVISYLIGREGPPPDLAVEVLSPRTARGRDLGVKANIYARLGVPEYLLIDWRREWLDGPLLMKRLRPDGGWDDVVDEDGGVTSALGVRIVWESDNRPRVIDTATGKRYARPNEAQHEADGRVEAEARAKAEAKARRAEAKARRAEEKARREEEKARREAERRADAETLARQIAERRLAEETAARAALEERLRVLEAEMNRRRPTAEPGPGTEPK